MKTRNAFTLVELLVVIGIIALLISILLPSLNKARETANTVACSSNMRQVGLALTMYANQNKGYLPPGGWDYNIWHWVLDEADLLKVTTSSAYMCPSAPGGGLIHYGVHPRLMPHTGTGDPSVPTPGANYTLYKLARVRPAQEKVMVFEAVLNPEYTVSVNGANYSNNAEPYSYNIHSSRTFWQGFVYDALDTSNSDPVVTYGINQDAGGWGDSVRGHMRWRHNGNKYQNFLFADGHVSTLRGGVVNGKVANGGELKGLNLMVAK